MLPQKIAESHLNITSILKNFESFIKQLFQKERTQNINKKKDQNNYCRAEISKKDQPILRLKVKKNIDF